VTNWVCFHTPPSFFAQERHKLGLFGAQGRDPSPVTCGLLISVFISGSVRSSSDVVLYMTPAENPVFRDL
jgi:hypothetical protein